MKVYAHLSHMTSSQEGLCPPKSHDTRTWDRKETEIQVSDTRHVIYITNKKMKYEHKDPNFLETRTFTKYCDLI